jgi:hypothetical protein
MRPRLVSVVFCVLLGVAGTFAATGPAAASSTPMSLKGWMLAEGEANTFAGAYGKPVPVQWVTCADYPTKPKPNPSSCGREIKIGKGRTAEGFHDLIRETAYYDLRNEIQAGYIRPGDGVLADYETWSQTPPSQQKDPLLYICDTDQLAAKHHLFLVQSPFNPSPSVRVEEETEAARCAVQYHTDEVTELQYQGKELNASTYRQFITAAVNSIRAVDKNAKIIGGLATDLKGKDDPKPEAVPFCDLVHSYFATKDMLIGYWLNSSTHTALALQFFEDLNAIAGTKTKC